MKITKKSLTKLLLTELDNLDPVSVIVENFELGRGKIIIECFGESWASTWGAIGLDRNISQFFCDCSNDYLIKNLSQVKRTITDFDKINEAAETKNLARQNKDCPGYQVLEELYGCDWLYNLPEKTNPDYEYLWRIIDVVKKALIQ